MVERKLEVLTKEFVESGKEMMDAMFANVGITDLMEETDDEMLILLKKALKFLNQANEIVTAQASLLCDMDNKLDTLLRIKEA